MATSSPNRPTRRRARTVTTALSALAVGVVATGAGAGVAGATQPAPLPHTPTSLTNRVLSVVDTADSNQASRTTELQYVNPKNNVSYLLTDQYAGSTPNYISWEKDTPKGTGHRSVDQIDIDPGQKSWSEQNATVASLPAPGLGIESTGKAVKQAITQGKATKQGMTKIARQTVLSLSLKPSSKSVVSEHLYVDPSTDQPIVEISRIKSGGHSYTVTSNWETASASRVSKVESKPAIPSGYTKSSN
jgi:hypothetical protein